MNHDTQPETQVDPLLKEAAQDEQAALSGFLQNRVIMLNAEVRRRDLRILELEGDLQALRAAVETPEAAPWLAGSPRPPVDTLTRGPYLRWGTFARTVIRVTAPIPEPAPHRPKRATVFKFRRARIWVVDRVPLPLLTHAHEAGLAIALGMVATPFVLGIAPGPQSVHSQVPFPIALVWAWTLVVSAVLTLWGLFRTAPRAEWAGQLFTGYGLTFYSLAIIWGNGVNGFLAASTFACLGIVAWWRSFQISNAPLVQHRLVAEARTAHELAHVTKMKATTARQGRARQ